MRRILSRWNCIKEYTDGRLYTVGKVLVSSSRSIASLEGGRSAGGRSNGPAVCNADGEPKSKHEQHDDPEPPHRVRGQDLVEHRGQSGNRHRSKVWKPLRDTAPFKNQHDLFRGPGKSLTVARAAERMCRRVTTELCGDQRPQNSCHNSAYP